LGSERIGWDVLGLLKLLIVAIAMLRVYIWYDLEQDGIVVWWRWRPPLLLILLKIFLTPPFLPPNLPPNDRLRKDDL
jgi:hypothetical protein